jgi:hypothetical protein
MSSLRMLACLALAAAPSAVAAQSAPLPADVAAGRLAIALRLEPTYSLHEPVVATLEIHNRTAVPVDLDLGKNARGNLLVTVTEPDGHREVRQPLEPPDGIFFPGNVAVPPGGSYETDLVLNDWDGFAQPGRYAVSVELLHQAVVPSPATLAAAASLEVGPYDSGALRTSCERLAQRTLTGRGERATAAAHALSFAADEACLPALAQVFHAGFGPRYAVMAGLARLGTKAALAVVVDGWNGLDELSQQLVLQAFAAAGRSAALHEALEKAGKTWRVKTP